VSNRKFPTRTPNPFDLNLGSAICTPSASRWKWEAESLPGRRVPWCPCSACPIIRHSRLAARDVRECEKCREMESSQTLTAEPGKGIRRGNLSWLVQMPEIALETMSTNCGYNIKVDITPRSTLFLSTLHYPRHETEIWKTRNCRPGRWSSGFQSIQTKYKPDQKPMQRWS